MELKKPTTIKSPDRLGVTIKRLSSVLEKDLNSHIEAEAYSSQIYLAMSMWCKDNGYFGAAKLFKKYSDEELTHMNKIYEFLLDRDCCPITPAISKPQNEYLDILDVIETSYKHEISVSDSYYITADLALKEGCHAGYVFTQWFVKEQIEEEAKFADLIYKYNILMKTGVTGIALMEFDGILEEYN
jgi:ferritin